MSSALGQFDQEWIWELSSCSNVTRVHVGHRSQTDSARPLSLLSTPSFLVFWSGESMSFYLQRQRHLRSAGIRLPVQAPGVAHVDLPIAPRSRSYSPTTSELRWAGRKGVKFELETPMRSVGATRCILAHSSDEWSARWRNCDGVEKYTGPFTIVIMMSLSIPHINLGTEQYSKGTLIHLQHNPAHIAY